MTINFYDSTQLHVLRRDVMRPGMDISHVIYPEDTHPTAFNLGIEQDGKIIACVTAFQSTNPDLPQKVQYRIRALCVDENYRMRGIARKLFQRVIDEVVARGAEAIWFTARVHLVDFYRSFGFTEYGEQFLIPNSCMHVKMYKVISK